ncbi:MAG: hypothetical protein ACKPE1_21340, partial [Dolichospermum sp.]
MPRRPWAPRRAWPACPEPIGTGSQWRGLTCAANDRIKIYFQVDEQRFLRITIEDLLTNSILAENQLVTQLN